MPEYVTLEDMMGFREQKAARQEKILRQCMGSVVVTIGMNIPGPIKTAPEILCAFQAGTQALDACFNQAEVAVSYTETVTERQGLLKLYGLTETDAWKIKGMTTALEENHPLGRLFDIDVYDRQGKGISRQELGLAGRTCLLCENDAKVCGRSRAHTTEALYAHILELIQTWACHCGSEIELP